MNNQQSRVIAWLKEKPLTRLQGWSQLGILEVPARISELRAQGWRIHTEMVTVKNRFGEKVRIAKWSLA
jgi:hypothetical protein